MTVRDRGISRGKSEIRDFGAGLVFYLIEELLGSPQDVF